ncbi:MAG: M10 family metallopeptidase [Halothiobacillaceae bacterium]|nr:M10 family metallopeptidase [Halothiobacillaceae bacterium]
MTGSFGGNTVSVTTIWSTPELVARSGVLEIDALLGEMKWANPSITYSFPGYTALWSENSVTGYGPSYLVAEPWSSSYAPLSKDEQKYFAQALQRWADVAGVSFIQIPDSAAVGDIRAAFSYLSANADAQAWTWMPGNTSAAGDVWFNTISSSATETWSPGSYSFFTAVHEIGHALGLKHSFNDAGSTAIVLPAALDNIRNTVMSYTFPEDSLFRSFSYDAWGSLVLQTSQVVPDTPMVFDIAAIQYLYGANTTFNTGDDVYSFDNATPFYRSIWDAGGTDTISAANFGLGCVIDLTPGAYSSLSIVSPPIPSGYRVSGGTQPTYDGSDNLGIAFGTIIENAIGGSGSDTLRGNDAGNVLRGGGGDDAIDGGAGIDLAEMGGRRADYSLARSNDGYVVVDRTGADGTDTLTNIERLHFSDVNVALDVVDGNAGVVARFMGAVFGAGAVAGAPYSKEYTGYGLAFLDGGGTQDDLMQIALEARLGGGFTDAEVVDLLFRNIAEQPPTPDELDYFTAGLEAREYSAATLAITAAELELNITNIDLVGLAASGLEFI